MLRLRRKYIQKFGQKFSCGFSKLPCTCPNERFEGNDILSNISISVFFLTLSGNYRAVLSKGNLTRPEEPMKNEVLIQSSLIPKQVFASWRTYFGLRLKHFSMVGDTAFFTFEERIQQGNFRDNFCFSLVTRVWVKRFLIFGRNFPSRYQ